MTRYTGARGVRGAILGLIVAAAAVALTQSSAFAAPSFTVSVSPPSHTVAPGESEPYTVTVSATGNFSGPVTLTLSDPTGSGITGSFAPTSALTLPRNGSASTTLTLSTTTATPPQSNTPVTITATSGSLTKSTVATLTVTAPGDFSLSTSPTTVTVPAGLGAQTQVTVTGVGGWNTPVALSVTGLPSRVTTALAPPGTVPITVGVQVGTASLTFIAAPNANPGTSTVTVRGTSAGRTRTSTVTLTITARPRISLAAVPVRVVTQPAGPDATYDLTATMRNMPDDTPLTFTVSGLPGGTTGSFTPNPAVANPSADRTTRLAVTAGASAPIGRFSLVVTATGTPAGTVGTVSDSKTVKLVIEPPPIPFTISGPIGQTTLLAPGVTIPLNLRITNPNKKPLSVSSLAVAVGTTSDESVCSGVDNYAAQQFSGAYAALTVPADSSRTLEQLGIPPADWPQLTMRNLPTNQDGCKDKRVGLTFTGTGSGGIQ
jgi:hypothetical protein